MATEQTKLAIDALRRDLERYKDYVSDMVLAEAARIKARMIDTVNETIKDDTDPDQVMEIIDIVNQIYDHRVAS